MGWERCVRRHPRHPFRIDTSLILAQNPAKPCRRYRKIAPVLNARQHGSTLFRPRRPASGMSHRICSLKIRNWKGQDGMIRTVRHSQTKGRATGKRQQSSGGMRKIRIMIAAPADVSREREQVRTVAARLNKIVDELGLQIEPVGWEDVAPDVDLEGGQKVVDRHIRYEELDVLVGIFWKHLGTPLSDSQPTGTVHEILEAYNC